MPLDRRHLLGTALGSGLLYSTASAQGSSAPPQPQIEDERLRALLRPDARLLVLAEGLKWAEGPVWVPTQGLVFSDVRADCEMLWQSSGVRVRRSPAAHSNGHALMPDGRIVVAEQGTRCISRTEADGSNRTVLVEHYEGKRLNSPNDLVARRDGTIWFTDPVYGLTQVEESYGNALELAHSYVYRFDPVKNALEVMSGDFIQPNGIAFSPDESVLYVSESAGGDGPGPLGVFAHTVGADGKLRDRRFLFAAEQGMVDGFRVDRDGNLWCSSGAGIEVRAPDGKRLGLIPVGEGKEGLVGNMAFGGEDGSRLFICASTRLLALDTATRGAAG